jgi:hypothetical protein
MNELNEPLRLTRKRGHWTLEVTKLVPIDRHVLRPERRRVNGTDSVVRHLKERCAPSLVREALDLIVGEDDGTDRAFELEGEHWVQLQDQADAETSGSAHAALVAVVGELRAELTTMRALHEALRGRLAAVERRSLQLGAADYGRGGLRAAPRRELGGASLRPALRGRSAAPAAHEAAATAIAGAPAAGLEDARTQAAVTPVAAAAEAKSATPEPPPTRPLLVMPQQADIATCLKQLLGADAELRSERGNLPKDLDAFYVSRVIDAADKEVGAILLDLRGGVELGGRLLGFPPSAIEEQAKADPSSDMLDAMNEITNNLGGFINRANPDLRVRVRPLEKLSSAEFGWLSTSSARIGNATKTGGRLWISARGAD